MNGRQVAMARAALAWTTVELAKQSGVSKSTIVRSEGGGGLNAATADTLRKTFEKAGLVILDNGNASNDGGPGVRFRDRQ